MEQQSKYHAAQAGISSVLRHFLLICPLRVEINIGTKTNMNNPMSILTFLRFLLTRLLHSKMDVHTKWNVNNTQVTITLADRFMERNKIL
jgi:hypothetical protein